MTDRPPLALFVYNRPRHTARMLDAVAASSRLADVRVVVYADAARQPEHADAVAETRRVVRDWMRGRQAELVERQQNLGLARSIAGSVTDLTRAFGRVIVLEDDLVPAPDFLSFVLEGLDRYADADEVAQIAGCLLPGSVPSAQDGIFLPLTTTWGWATWERAWRHFRWEDDVDLQEIERDPVFRDRFTMGGTIDYVAMLKDRLNGANSSWGILWWYSVARMGKLVLYPRKSLIWNGGFDSTGVHCGGNAAFSSHAPADFRSPRLPAEIALPDLPAIDQAAFEAVIDHLRTQGGMPSDTLPRPRSARWPILGNWAGWAKRLRHRPPRAG